jgi:hypothetical protein
MPPVLDVEAIERESARAAISDVVEYLQDHLGSMTVAYLAGLKNTQMLRRWKGGSEPQQLVKLRLRSAYQSTRMLVETFDDETAEAWFFGSNSKLDDEAPARVLRVAQSFDEMRLIVPAAKAFTRAPE